MPATTGHRLAALGAALVAACLGCLTAAPALAAAPSAPAAPAATETSGGAASLVAAEDRRLTEVRTVTSLARWQDKRYEAPYRISSGSGYTLVLTARSASYTLADLLALAPQTFLKLNDGSYLLSENLVVATGATLHLAQAGGLTVRLLSTSASFVSLVSMGGTLEFAGEQGAPVTLTSWDPSAGAVDTTTQDGRAYVRALGGHVDAAHLVASHLGFWSGRTGGVALTGTDRPNTGAIHPVGDPAPDGSAPSVLEGVTTQPAGPLAPGQTNPNLDYTVPSMDYVSSRISDSTFDGNAFGLFVSDANGVQIDRSQVLHSSVSGIVLHRYVTDGVITSTATTDNAGNGLTLDRATTGITVSGLTAARNAGSGISLSGRPLADGPSPTGSTTVGYGGNAVTNCVVTHNGRYGIQVVGGFNIGISNNRVSDNDMGILVTGPAERIAVTGNDVDDSARHGIALTTGVSRSSVTGNVVDGAATGIYVRDSTGTIQSNTVQAATAHGISLVGAVAGSSIGANSLAGTGASAVDTGRSRGAVTRTGDQTDGWHDTSPWYLWFKQLLHPMNALWAAIAVLVLLSALRSRGRRVAVAHPYAHQMEHQGVLAMPSASTGAAHPDDRVGAPLAAGVP